MISDGKNSMKPLVTDHCIKRVVERTLCPFDYDSIKEQIMILIFVSGCSFDGVEYVWTCDGVLILDDGVAITFLPQGGRPKKSRASARAYHWKRKRNIAK
jgi:hypothetical protein